MTEKEKMLSYTLYDANNDKQLIHERALCQELCYEYNLTRPSNMLDKESIMRKLLGKIKGKFTIMSPFLCDYGYNIEIGDNFFSNYNCVILDAGKVTFGDNVFIAPDCSFYTSGHPIDSERRNAGLEYAYPITIGNDVWIGGGVRVLPGVKIGNNVVIGSGSVVSKDIPDNVVAYGNPCRVARKITDNDKFTHFKYL